MSMEDFLGEISARPDDDVPRLILADWLEERGDHSRAEFIRLQCARSSEPDADCADAEASGVSRRREDQLLRQFETTWTEPLRHIVTRCVFHRGMIEYVVMPATAFVEHAELIFREAPVHSVTLTFSSNEREAFESLAECVHLEKLTGLCLMGSMDEDDWDALGQSDHLRGIRKLICSSCDLNDLCVRAIAVCPSLTNLELLDLSRNQIRNAGIQLLAVSPNVAQLRTLLLSENEIRMRGVQALAGSSRLNNLKYIDVRMNPILPRGIQLLRKRFGRNACET